MNIETRKIALIQQILTINKESLIRELETKLIQLLPKYKPPFVPQTSEGENNKLNPPITEIRKNVSLDEIVAEQKTIPINYEDIQHSTKKMKWKHSLAELLEALN